MGRAPARAPELVTPDVTAAIVSTLFFIVARCYPRRTNSVLRGQIVKRCAVAAILVSILGFGAPGSLASAEPDHDHEVCEATSRDERRAAGFARATTEALRPYEDVRIAVARGYRPFLVATALLPVVHYSNRSLYEDGHVADPERVETLMYANTYNGPKLIGAMYLMEPADAEPPDVGGCIAQWHRHVMCEYADGRQTPSLNRRTCPRGTTQTYSAAMLHVWTVPMSGGPYQRHPDAQWQCWPRPAPLCQ